MVVAVKCLNRLGVGLTHVNALNLPSIVLEFFGTRGLCYHAVILSKTLTLRTSYFFPSSSPCPVLFPYLLGRFSALTFTGNNHFVSDSKMYLD
mgnify:CR=1 FL=1